MISSVLALTLLLASTRGAAAQEAPATSTAPVSYGYGMEQRGKGDYAGARETFLRLLENSPDSRGALEGLALSCIGLKKYEEALGYLLRWNALSPHSPYVLGLLARVQNSLRDYEGVIRVDAAFMRWYMARPGLGPAHSFVCLSGDTLVANAFADLDHVSLGDFVVFDGPVALRPGETGWLFPESRSVFGLGETPAPAVEGKKLAGQ